MSNPSRMLFHVNFTRANITTPRRLDFYEPASPQTPRSPHDARSPQTHQSPQTPPRMTRTAKNHWQTILSIQPPLPKKIPTFIEMMEGDEYATLSKEERALLVVEHYEKLALRDLQQLGLSKKKPTRTIKHMPFDILNYILGFLDLFSAVSATCTSTFFHQLRIQPDANHLERFFNPRNVLVGYHHDGEAYKGVCAWIFDPDKNKYPLGVASLIVCFDIPNCTTPESYSAIPFAEIGSRVTFDQRRVAQGFFPRKNIIKSIKASYAPDSSLPHYIASNNTYFGSCTCDSSRDECKHEIPMYTLPSNARHIMDMVNLNKYSVGEKAPVDYTYEHVEIALHLEATRPNGLSYSVDPITSIQYPFY